MKVVNLIEWKKKHKIFNPKIFGADLGQKGCYHIGVTFNMLDAGSISEYIIKMENEIKEILDFPIGDTNLDNRGLEVILMAYDYLKILKTLEDGINLNEGN